MEEVDTIVKSDIVVRKASNNSQSGFDISSIIIGAGNQSSMEDALFLQTYLESPQVLKGLDNIFKLEEVYKKGVLIYMQVFQKIQIWNKI